MGGDTIIDHVSVNYAANSVTFSGTYPQMIAAGGYVGLVGGATHVTENTDYEKTGGGVYLEIWMEHPTPLRLRAQLRQRPIKQ